MLVATLITESDAFESNFGYCEFVQRKRTRTRSPARQLWRRSLNVTGIVDKSQHAHVMGLPPAEWLIADVSQSAFASGAATEHPGLSLILDGVLCLYYSGLPA